MSHHHSPPVYDGVDGVGGVVSNASNTSEPKFVGSSEKEDVAGRRSGSYSGSGENLFTDTGDQLHRRLRNRQIQLIAIGGSIGTALFLSIGSGLVRGGPGSLFIAYTLYSLVLGLVNNCIAEMTVYMPVGGGFIRLAGKWVDDAFGFMAGWNFFLYEALLIPFEISALSVVLTYWRDDIPAGAICGAVIASYM